MTKRNLQYIDPSIHLYLSNNKQFKMLYTSPVIYAAYKRAKHLCMLATIRHITPLQLQCDITDESQKYAQMLHPRNIDTREIPTFVFRALS